MPRSTAVRIREIISFVSPGGPKPKLIPMQPSPMADTSKLLFPSLRFCIVSPELAKIAVAAKARHPKHSLQTLSLLPIPKKFLPDSPETHIQGFVAFPVRERFHRCDKGGSATFC